MNSTEARWFQAVASSGTARDPDVDAVIDEAYAATGSTRSLRGHIDEDPPSSVEILSIERLEPGER